MSEMRVSPGPSDTVGPDPDRPVDSTGATWVFWVGLLTAAYPLLVTVGVAHLQLTTQDERFLPVGPGEGPVVAADRWAQLVTTAPPGRTALLSALVALVLAVTLAAPRPGWLRSGTVGAWGLAAVGAADVLFALGGLGLHRWNAVRDPTALETPSNPYPYPSSGYHWAWLTDASMGVTALLLGVVVTVLAVRHATRPGGPREPGGRTVGG